MGDSKSLLTIYGIKAVALRLMSLLLAFKPCDVKLLRTGLTDDAYLDKFNPIVSNLLTLT